MKEIGTQLLAAQLQQFGFDNMNKRSDPKLIKFCRGFTFLEILVVVTIIGFVAAIAWNQYRGQLIKGKRSDAVTALTSVRTALISFKSDNGNYPADPVTAVNFLTNGYRASAPNTPATNCRAERGFQAIAGTAANSVLSCQGLWNIQVLNTNANSFTLRAMTAPGHVDLECQFLDLDNLNVRNFTPTAQGLADNIPMNRCWTE